MSEPTELSDLLAYLVRTSRLTHSEAIRFVDEVLSFFDERPEEFVCRRHRTLQSEGMSRDLLPTTGRLGALAVSRPGLHRTPDPAAIYG